MEQARRIDRLTLIVVLVYVVGYAFLYGLVYQCASVCAEIKTLRSPSCVTDQLIYTQMSINRECGCFRHHQWYSIICIRRTRLGHP